MPPGPIDASGLIPTTYATQIIQGVLQQSAVLALGKRMPMGSGIAEIPIAGAFPTAGFVSTGARKPFTDFKLTQQTMRAEEIAAVISIPQNYLDDTSIDLWGYARPLLAQAIAACFDNAVIWGVGAPASYPSGGIADPAFSTVVAAGTDPLDTVNKAMGVVEAQGVPVTGSAADLVVKAALRGVRDAGGALLLGPAQAESPAMQSLYGVPIAFTLNSPQAQDFITGDWDALLVGVRQDIRYDTSTEGVLADADGKILVSAFQDDQVLMRVYARFGVVVAQPVTVRAPNGAKPFALADVAPAITGFSADADSGPDTASADTTPAPATGTTKKTASSSASS